MLNFDKYLMRHGEGWILQIVEDTERHRGIRSQGSLTLEERWDFLMNDLPVQSQLMAA